MYVCYCVIHFSILLMFSLKNSSFLSGLNHEILYLGIF
ncbi:hypothetical protein GYH30_034351 [Glycine max]|nr:hypothetical protein GYH30_034351 [Glycine max]